MPSASRYPLYSRVWITTDRQLPMECLCRIRTYTWRMAPKCHVATELDLHQLVLVHGMRIHSSCFLGTLRTSHFRIQCGSPIGQSGAPRWLLELGRRLTW